MRAAGDDQFERDCEAMRQAWLKTHPLDPVAQLANAVSGAVARPAAPPAPLPARGRRVQGRFPDGRPVPAAFKRAVYENYELVKAAHRAEAENELRSAYYRGEIDQQELPDRLLMLNSARPGGPSPMIRQLYGLD